MKKFFSKALMFVAAMLMLGFTATAQQGMELTPDKDVRIGKLSNGLTYYIRHNEKPKGQADFYIAQKVGSILEEDSQRGLAHFLEHMCFNGTTNFPGKNIINWLESIGVKFGVNLNAYTSVDETVYNISNVPVFNQNIQDSCLLILHDWANDLLLEDAEIDAERGVIHQEWRRSMVGQMRIIENLLPTIYPDSKYGYRLPIGTMDVVDNFPYQELRDYYQRWYRPDQQGIIVVGDINVDYIENKIKEMFSDIEMPADAPAREYFPVPDNQGTIFAIGSDKEQEHAIVSMMFKTEAFPDEAKNTAQYLIQEYAMDIITDMLNSRLNNMATKADCTFSQAGASYDNFFLAKTKDAFDMTGVSKTNDIVPVIEALYRELLRARDGGFTVGEYQRAQQEYLSRLEKDYAGRNDKRSSYYVNQYVQNFVNNEPIPSIEDRYNMMSAIVPNIPVSLINQILPGIITADNRVVLALLPEVDGVSNPTEEQISAVINAVDNEEIEAYVDEMKSEPLIPNLPAPGKIVAETTDTTWDATVLTLSNGVKVYVKPTTFKEDEVLFEATAIGGTSVYPDDLANELRMVGMVDGSNGLGDYTETDLQKYLAGKQAHVSFDFSDYNRSVSGSAVPKDLPTLMELIYMSFTDVTMTPDDYSALQQRLSSLIKNQENNPQFIFSRDLTHVLYANPRNQVQTPDDILAADREKTLGIIHDMTANAADYTFFFVGNIDMDTFRPLVEQYIATLPADAAKVTNTYEVNKTLEFPDGMVNETAVTPMQTPQTWVFIGAFDSLPYTSKDSKVASIAGQVLSKRLLDKVREEMGAVYSISAQGSMGRLNGKNVIIQTAFPMKPEMKAEVLDFIKAEMGRMTGDVTEEEVAKAVEYMVKNATDAFELNYGWLNAMTGWSINGVDNFNGIIETLKAITVADVQNFMKQIVDNQNMVVFTLDPAAEAAE